MQGSEEIDVELADEIGECVKQLLQLLEPAHGEILTLVDVEGVDVPAAAKRLGLAVAAARVRLHRARASLRMLLTLSCAGCPHPLCDGCGCAGCAASGRGRNECH